MHNRENSVEENALMANSFQSVFCRENQIADLLDAMASGGGQNEYIWIK